jgi:hypothetical protein
VATKKRSSTANGKSTSTRKTSPRSRKRAAPVTEPPIESEAPEEIAAAPIEESTPVVTIVPEPGFAARFAPPPPPRPRPEQRRGIFFDVENTSRTQDIDHVLRYLMIDRVGIDTDFTAVGNWRVIGHETARLLAQNGASLVHSAPSTGVRDWSDLRIAVAAGVWLASARPGDMIDIVSDDQAFDAVGDVASSLGVQYRRLSYRSLRGQVEHDVADEPVRRTSSDGASRSRRRGRGGRGRRGPDRRQEAPRYHAPEPRRAHHEPAPVRAAAAAPAPVEDDPNAHTAPHDELIDVVRDMMSTSPGGVTLDQLANALRERGFRRTPGSPRLITRLKRIKEIDVNRNGLIRVDENGEAPPARTAADEPVDIDPDDAGADVEHAGADDDNGDIEAAPGEGEAEGTGEGGQRRRRRRRRGGRGRRGRRGGTGGPDASADANGEVIAAAPSSFPEY